MAADKNLFLHDLAVAAILKDEGKYLKEWLDYHLLAGVDHFYLYNHESEDNYEDIIKPYVDAGLVTSIYWPGERAMTPAHNDAVKKFKFFNRYMAFIDLDEFIYPKITWGALSKSSTKFCHVYQTRQAWQFIGRSSARTDKKKPIIRAVS